MHARRRARGFTLIELMIAVALIAILAVIAYPNFLEQVRKSRRADATSALLACAQMLERFSTQSGNYAAGADAAVRAACTGSSANGHYTLPVGNIPAGAGAGTFLIRATPAGAQANDKCGTFTYTQDGTKGLVDSTQTARNCW